MSKSERWPLLVPTKKEREKEKEEKERKNGEPRKEK